VIETFTIEAGNETLLRQAPMTAHDYLLKAVSNIDEILGEGYARAHPELLGAFIQTAALDFGAAVIASAIQDELGAINRTLEMWKAGEVMDPELMTQRS
jgi:hypothetical protein